MITLIQILERFFLSIVLGAILGTERELVGKKDAGVRTEILVSVGATIFTIIGISLPYLIAQNSSDITDIIARNSGFLQIISNIVVGIGFLGGGLIIKNEDRTHGITTAAMVWTTAAIGILVGLGMIEFAIIATISIAIILYILRSLDITQKVKDKKQI